MKARQPRCWRRISSAKRQRHRPSRADLEDQPGLIRECWLPRTSMPSRSFTKLIASVLSGRRKRADTAASRLRQTSGKALALIAFPVIAFAVTDFAVGMVTPATTSMAPRPKSSRCCCLPS
jgi:hypothetical protein